MEIKKNIYFVGAGGIGMAALERYFLAKGHNVAGYDRTPTELTDALRAEGAEISFADSTEAIPAAFRDPGDTLVVYTPAVPESHPVMQFFRNGNFEVMKRSAVLGAITRTTNGLCFSGTHGKTTTSSMAAWILANSTTGCNAFLGGVLRNTGSNLVLSDRSPLSVIEADEYDRSFHRLSPFVAVVTSTDPDHLDIYDNEENYLESFAHFTSLIRPGGYLVVHEGLKLRPRVADGVEILTYSRDHGDFHAENITYGNGELKFDIVTPGLTISDISLGVPVEVNIENAIAAVAAIYLAGALEPENARKALGTFKGARRRFEFWLKEPMPGGHVIIDDYAHHPDELKASISSVRALYPGCKLTVAFQPHLYSRTRDFAPAFAAALSLADDVVLTDIYPAREEPIPGVTSSIIYDAVTSAAKTLVARSEIATAIASRSPEVVLVAGAGDINLELPAIRAAFTGEVTPHNP